MTHKTQVHIEVSNIENLCCINCKINPIGTQDPLVKSLFHSQTLTCRLIIYTIRCCIASPSIQNVEDLIHIIVNKSFYNSGKLQEHLSKMKIHYFDPEPVNPKIYEACLKYTFTFRLAPHWNSIGKCYYLQGFNFLSLTSNINAIEWNILLKNSCDLKLELIPMKMNLFPLTLDSLSLPPKTMDGFLLNDNINSLDLTYDSPWVYVLPKLTKGRITSVSKILPESCLFKCYDDLRRHWKNMYSYRLPKNEHGLLFYEVVFPSQPNQYFTYPETCILSKMPDILMCDNKNEIASQYLKDLSTNVHSVCGKVIQICQLYPELDIEYSCIRKTSKISENKNGQFQQYSVSKTPADQIMKTFNKKIHLSSLFTFKGEKIRPNIQKQPQNVVPMMQNKKGKRKSIIDYEDGYSMQSIFNRKKRKFEISQKCLLPIPDAQEKKTIIHDLEEIISFYDIPSMCPNNNELEKSNVATCLQQNGNNKSINPKCELSRPQPIIKNVENLCSDFTESLLFSNCKTSKIMENETNEEDENVLCKISYDTTHSRLHLLNSMKQEDASQNLVPKQGRPELHKIPSFDCDKTNQKLQSSIRSVDLDRKVLSKLQSNKTDDINSNPAETQSYDEKIQSFLSTFNCYNNHNYDESDIEKQLFEQYKKSALKTYVNNETSKENCEKQILKESLEKLEFLEDCQYNPIHDLRLDKWSDKSSEMSFSSFSVKKNSRPNVSLTHSRESLINSKNKKIKSKSSYLFEDDCITKGGHVALLDTTEEKKYQNKNHEQNVYETSKISSSTNDFLESKITKILPKCETSYEERFLNKEIENMTSSELTQNNKTGKVEKTNEELHHSFITLDNLPNICETPSLGSILQIPNNPMDNSEVSDNKFNNTPQLSTDILHRHSEVNKINIKRDINEFPGQSDFFSILSESSNGSDTNDYESCKLVFEEALTFKK